MLGRSESEIASPEEELLETWPGATPTGRTASSGDVSAKQSANDLGDVEGIAERSNANAAGDATRVATSPLLRLTPLSGWLLGMPDWGPPPALAPASCKQQAKNPDVILAPSDVSPVHLAWLAACCIWHPVERPALHQRFQVSAERIGLAVAGGLEVNQILLHLEDALGKPLSRRLTQQIRRWGEAGELVRIRHVVLLETADSALMGRLRSQKLLRRYLSDALSPTRSTVDPAGLPALVQALRSAGLYTALPPSPDSRTARSGRALEGLAGLSLLYAAGLVYQGLGEHVALSWPLSGDLLDKISQELNTTEREAAEHAAKSTLEEIETALRGYYSFPAWQVRHLSQGTLSLLENALGQGRDVVLTYHAAAREEPIVRRVTPYWLENRRSVAYLVGYCHLREAERVFRVDRISHCVLADQAGAQASGPAAS